MKSINLLLGADIVIREEKPGEYTAIAMVGNYHKTAMSKDLIRAIGIAVLLQAGYTEQGLKKELSK